MLRRNSFEEFVQLLRKLFPDLTQIADQRSIHLWGEVDDGEPHLWMEQFANAVNGLMESEHKEQLMVVFELFSNRLEDCTDELKRLIDVGFVENLFWRVSEKGCKLGWQLLPTNLKSLYVGFHGQPPI